MLRFEDVRLNATHKDDGDVDDDGAAVAADDNSDNSFVPVKYYYMGAAGCWPGPEFWRAPPADTPQRRNHVAYKHNTRAHTRTHQTAQTSFVYTTNTLLNTVLNTSSIIR